MSKIKGNTLVTCVLEFKETRIGGNLYGTVEIDDELELLTGLSQEILNALFEPAKKELKKFAEMVGELIIKQKDGKVRTIKPDDEYIEFIKILNEKISERRRSTNVNNRQR